MPGGFLQSPPPALSAPPRSPSAPVRRLLLPHEALSLGVAAEVEGDVFEVARASFPLAQYRPFAREGGGGLDDDDDDDDAGEKERRREEEAGAVVMGEDEDTVSFFVYTADKRLDAALSLLRPVAASLAPDALEVSLAAFEGELRPLPFVDVKGGTKVVRAVMGVPVTVSVECLREGAHRLAVHFSVVATPDEQVPVAPPPPPAVTPIKRVRRLMAGGGVGGGGGDDDEGDRVRTVSVGFTKFCPASGEGQGTAATAEGQVRLPGLLIGSGSVPTEPDDGAPRRQWPTQARDVAEDGIVSPEFRADGQLRLVGPEESHSTFYVRRVSALGPADEEDEEEEEEAPEADDGGGSALAQMAKSWLARVASAIHGLSSVVLKRAVVTAEDQTVLRVSAAGRLGSEAVTEIGGGGGAAGVPSVAKLVVKYSCVRDGQTTVTVVLPTQAGPLTFRYLKDCAGFEREAGPDEGAVLPGVHVGTAANLSDVVRDGLTEPAFATELDEEEELDDMERRFFVGPDTPAVTFFLWREPAAPGARREARRPLAYRRPLVVAEPPIIDGDEAYLPQSGGVPVAFPLVSGAAAVTDTLAPGGAPLELVVEFRCVRGGTTTVTVKVPMERHAGDLVFSFTKDCDESAADGADAEDEADGDFELRPVRGFSIGTPGAERAGGTDGQSNVLHDGQLSPRWHWRSLVSELHTFGPDRPYALFTLSYADERMPDADAGGVPQKVTSVRVDPPTLFSHYRVVEPELGGSARNGFELAHGSRRGLTVAFNCLPAPAGTPEAERTSMVTLVLPVTVREQPYVPPGMRMKRAAEWVTTMSELVVVTFAKVCPAAGGGGAGGAANGDGDGAGGVEAVPTVSAPPAASGGGGEGHTDGGSRLVPAGGVAVPGLRVGTSANASDVVLDGFPRVEYFGQALSERPAWGAVVVPARVSSVSVFVHFTTAAAGDDSLHFQAPVVAVHGGRTMGVELSGTAAGGGTLSRNGNVLELALSFRCRYKGTASAAVSLPVLDHGVVTFTVPKECDGKERPRGQRVPGVRVGTLPGASDVVSDGVPAAGFGGAAGGTHRLPFRVGGDKDGSTFYLSAAPAAGMKQQPPLLLLEPVVFSRSPLVSPTLRHSLERTLVAVRSAANGSESQLEEGDTLRLTAAPAALNVTYQCVWPGEAVVTVVVPVMPRGQVAFSFVKVCPGDPQSKPPGVEEMTGGGGGGGGNVADNDGREADGDEYGSDDDDDDDPWLLTWRERGGGLGPDTGEEGPDQDWDASAWNTDVGFLDVGTAAGSGDVVSGGVTQPAYLLPRYGSGHEIGDHDAVKMVSAAQTASVYRLSVPADARGKRQLYGLPTVVVGDPGVVRVSLSGQASGGGELRPGGAPHELRLDYVCREPGVTAVLVAVPLLPAQRGTVSFRVAKLCGGFEDEVDPFYWTADTALFSMLATACFAAGAFSYWRYQRRVFGGVGGKA